MAPIAGLLIEYLVVGAVAGLWGAPLALAAIAAHPQKDFATAVIACLIPALYLAGMVCDLNGQTVTHPFKELIETQVRSSHDEADVRSQKIHAFAVAYEPALAKEIDTRSTRDRIARGSLVAVSPFLVYWPYSFVPRYAASLLGILLVIALAMLWYRMQKLSASYEMQVLKTLRARHGEVIDKSFPRTNRRSDA